MQARRFLSQFAMLPIAGAVLVGLLCGCDGGAKPTTPVTAADPRTLKEIVEQFLDAHAKRDELRLAELAAPLVPTTAELRSCLKPGPDADAFVEKYKARDLDPESREVAALGKGIFLPGEPTRTEVHVYDATTEELVAYAKGTAAFEEFPGGMRRFAQKIAAPGRTWHVVTIVAPGERRGMKYSCFTRVNGRFVAIAKPWRLLPRDPEPDAERKGSDDPASSDDAMAEAR